MSADDVRNDRYSSASGEFRRRLTHVSGDNEHPLPNIVHSTQRPPHQQTKQPQPLLKPTKPPIQPQSNEPEPNQLRKESPTKPQKETPNHPNPTKQQPNLSEPNQTKPSNKHPDQLQPPQPKTTQSQHQNAPAVRSKAHKQQQTQPKHPNPTNNEPPQKKPQPSSASTITADKSSAAIPEPSGAAIQSVTRPQDSTADPLRTASHALSDFPQEGKSSENPRRRSRSLCKWTSLSICGCSKQRLHCGVSDRNGTPAQDFENWCAIFPADSNEEEEITADNETTGDERDTYDCTLCDQKCEDMQTFKTHLSSHREKMNPRKAGTSERSNPGGKVQCSQKAQETLQQSIYD